MAGFVLRAVHGAAFVPTPYAGAFGDVHAGDYNADYIQSFFEEGFTAGCGERQLLSGRGPHAGPDRGVHPEGDPRDGLLAAAVRRAPISSRRAVSADAGAALRRLDRGAVRGGGSRPAAARTRTVRTPGSPTNRWRRSWPRRFISRTYEDRAEERNEPHTSPNRFRRRLGGGGSASASALLLSAGCSSLRSPSRPDARRQGAARGRRRSGRSRCPAGRRPAR